MKNRCLVIILVGLTLIWSGNAMPQTGKHDPDFALTISTEEDTVKSQRDMDISVIVKETNISRHTINAGRLKEPGDWYTMSVALNGQPAPITEMYREILTPKRADPDPDVADTFGGLLYSIKPGESQTFKVPLTAYFDLSTPGRYEITFARGTERGRPVSVDVKSNTITITVLPADDQPAQQ